MPGFIVSIAPVIGWSWPAVAPFALMAAGAIGFKLILDSRDNVDEVGKLLRRKLLEEQSLQLQLDDLVDHAIFEDVKRGQAMVFQKDGMTLILSKDERNKLRVTVLGPKDGSKRELEAAGREFARELAQLFAQNRVVDELGRLNFDVVEESRNQEGEIVLKVRRWG